MENGKYSYVRFVSYYNIILSIFWFTGSLILYIFSNYTDHVSNKMAKFHYVIFVFFCLLMALSGVRFLHHNKMGRIGLLLCSIAQVLYCFEDIISSFETGASFALYNTIILVVGLWNIWYLNTKEAKEWTQRYKRGKRVS